MFVLLAESLGSEDGQHDMPCTSVELDMGGRHRQEREPRHLQHTLCCNLTQTSPSPERAPHHLPTTRCSLTLAIPLRSAGGRCNSKQAPCIAGQMSSTHGTQATPEAQACRSLQRWRPRESFKDG